MARRPVRLALACLAPLVALAAACGGGDPEGPEGELVVGVQAEELGALASYVQVRATVDGAVVAEEPSAGSFPAAIWM